MEHELKCDPDQFKLVMLGVKKFEYRKNDRDFKVKDVLILRETVHGNREIYTGAKLWFRVTHILPGGEYGVPVDYCVMSLAKQF